MACDTFIKIAQKCRRHFIIQQSGESEPFIDELLRSLHRITVDLSPAQVHTFYEAVGYMISQQPNVASREKLIGRLMDAPNMAVRPIAHILSNPKLKLTMNGLCSGTI